MSGAILLWQMYVSYIVSRKGGLGLCSAYVILYLILWYWIPSNNRNVCAYMCVSLHIQASLKHLNHL